MNAQNETHDVPSLEDTTKLVTEVAEALKKIVDEDSAKAAEPILKKWRGSLFTSKGKRDRAVIQKYFEFGEAFRKSYLSWLDEMNRIEAIELELADAVFTTMTGEKPFRPRITLTKIAAILKTIETEEGFRIVETELRTTAQPFYEFFVNNMERMTEAVAQDEKLKNAMEAVKAETLRIEKSDQVLGKKVQEAMVTEAVQNQLIKHAKEAQERALQARAKSDVFSFKMAVSSYLTEYRKYPVDKKAIGDHCQSVDQDLINILNAKDKNLNPRFISFLDLSENEKFLDPWGTEYRITIDTDYNNRLILPPEYKVKEETMGSIAVDSAGPDRKFNTVDDNITTWE